MPQESDFPTSSTEPDFARRAFSAPALVRPAEQSEANLLSSIAMQAKAYWGYPQEWLELWQDELTITPQLISRHWVFVAEISKRVAGFYMLAARSDYASLEHLWLLPEFIRLGLGRKLFLHAKQLAASQGFPFIQIVADPNAVGFYQRMGAVIMRDIRYQLFQTERVLPVMRLDILSETGEEI